LAPRDYRWPYYLGTLGQKDGRLEEASSHYRTTLSLRPDDGPTIYHLGEVFLQLNRLDEAEAHFREALVLDRSSAAARAGLGQVALLRRDFPRAIESFRAVLEAVPEADRLHYPLAMAYRHVGERDKAQEHLARSGTVGIRSRDPLMDELLELRRGERVHTLRGKLAFRSGKFADAVKEFTKAVEAVPDSFQSRVNLGSALAKLDRIDDAVTQYNEALRIEPRSENAHFNLGVLLAHRGAYDEAVVHLRAVVEIQPADHQAHVELAAALERKRAFADARDHYARAAEIEPEDARSHLGQARTLAAEGHYQRARARLEDAHEKIPSDGGIAQALARLLASSPEPSVRDGSRALDLARRVIEARPTAFHAETVAMALAEIGRCDEASRWQRIAIDLARRESRDDLTNRLNASLARYERGRPCASPARHGP